MQFAESFQPHVLLAFKGTFAQPQTLRKLRARGIALYNYYPDTSAFAHGTLLSHTLPEYDCIFYTKPFLDKDMRTRIALKQSVFLPHGYDPEVHRIWELDAEDRHRYGHDIVAIATYTPHKEHVLDALVQARPDSDIKIWGNGWKEYCRSSRLQRYIQGLPLTGSSYAKAIRAARINLAIMSGPVSGASQGDETTTRTYEIPACGGFMLHERSSELLDLYQEGKEVACFDSTRELIEKVNHYLAYPEKRTAIATQGYRRCVPAYSYDNRVRDILAWHSVQANEEVPEEALAS